MSFLAAADDRDGYPFLRRFHLGLTDMLQMEVPTELLPWLERVFRGPPPPVAEEICELMARRALDSDATDPERAFLEFFLYECLRVNLVVVGWLQDPHLSKLGMRLAEIDRLAADEFTAFLARAEELGPLERPVHVLFAIGLERFRQHFETFRAELRQLLTPYAREQHQRSIREATAEAELRQMPLDDAILVRNRIAPALGEQRLPLDLLQQDHPLALGDMARNTMDQRVSRALQKAKTTGQLPRRKRPAIIDLMQQAIDGGLDTMPFTLEVSP